MRRRPPARGGHAAQRRLQRRPGGCVRVRRRALGRPHAPGQPGVGGPGSRRHRTGALQRHVHGRGGRGRLGRPQQGLDPAGRRAAAPAGEHDRNGHGRPQAAAAVLVSAARREGRRRHDRRRPRHRRHERTLRHLRRREPRGLQRRGLGVRPRNVVRLSRHADQQRAGGAVRRRRLRDRAARQHELLELHAGVAAGRRSAASWRSSGRCSRACRRWSATARTASCSATGRRSRRSSSPTASGWTRTTTTSRAPGPSTGRASSPARAFRCASATSTAR